MFIILQIFFATRKICQSVICQSCQFFNWLPKFLRLSIAHLHDDVTREKDCGKCSQRSNMASKSGGFTCCVPGCFNNNKRNRNLSFYVFPQNEKLRKVWLRKISRKGFKPTSGHRVCSEHFEGGKKTYMNNIPTIFPLKTHQKSKSSERRPLIRDYNASERYKSQTGATASTIAAALTTERVGFGGRNQETAK